MAVNRNWVKTDGKHLEYAPTWLRTDAGIVVNPTDEQYRAAGWLKNARNSPETREGYVARVEGYEARDGQIYAVYAYEAVTPPPRVFSKLKLVIALKKRGLYEQFMVVVRAAALDAEWGAAQDIAEDFPGFADFTAQIGAALCLTDAQVEVILGEAVAR